MFQHKTNRYIAAVILLFVLLFALLRLTAAESSAANAGTASDALAAAWQRAQDRGGYHFTSDVVQVTVPEATLTNVGRTSREERLYLEGETNLRRQSADLRLWSDSVTSGGSALIPASGIQVQVADGTIPVSSPGLSSYLSS